MLYRSETSFFFFFFFSFGSSQHDWILVFIMIFMKALKLKFAYLSEYALFSFPFCRKSQRSSSAGWCLQPCMWWMQVIQPVRTKQRVLMIWHYEVMKLPCSTLATLLHTPVWMSFCFQSCLSSSWHTPYSSDSMADFLHFCLDGILQLHHIQKGGGKTVVKRICILSNHTLDPKGPKNVPRERPVHHDTTRRVGGIHAFMLFMLNSDLNIWTLKQKSKLRRGSIFQFFTVQFLVSSELSSVSCF